MSRVQIGLAIFALALIAAGLAYAHKAPAGWYIKSIDVLVPYKHPEIRISGDAHFHLCELPKGTVRCFYVPPGGV